MRFGEQARVLRMIPGLERAEFLRYGQVHRNTYINGPALLSASIASAHCTADFLRGQISGVEGYVEIDRNRLGRGARRGVARER
jgi:methylenetetrahydrofolate--tRNA-(uracil-5-)-methyltransferase